MDLMILSITISICSFGLTVHFACRLFKAENERAFKEEEIKRLIDLGKEKIYETVAKCHANLQYELSTEITELKKQINMAVTKPAKPKKKTFQVSRGKSVYHVKCETYYKSDGVLWFIDGGCDKTPVAVFPLADTIVETIK